MGLITFQPLEVGSKEKCIGCKRRASLQAVIDNDNYPTPCCDRLSCQAKASHATKALSQVYAKG